jgi:serine/threonine-protein kinase
MTDVLAQLSTSLADRYAIERQIGRGGMATVYLARDVRHDRKVALKVLNPELGAVLGVERFLAEIKVTANLQHPNLLPLFDSGEAGGLLFYVMPFVEGESLRSRLEREKQLPVDEALHITAAIASALDYAHAQSVIHRDLKPENILLQAGEPVVADFGIALAVSKAGGQRITQTGLSLGTPQYMSPEQAAGDRAIDGRTDVYSLGAILYEMLTGDPPHTGSTAQAIIAKVLTERPPRASVHRDAVPEHIDAAIEKALAKLPADRWTTARQFAEALQGAGGARAPAFAARPATGVSGESLLARARRWRAAWLAPVPLTLAALLAITAAALMWSIALRRAPADLGTASFHITLPRGLRMAQQTAVNFAFAPDGRSIVYVGTSGLKFQLHRRVLDDLEPKVLAGTEDGLRPTISPDSKWIAFFASGQLRRAPIEGGPTTTIGDATLEWGMSWAPGDVIVFGNKPPWPGLSRLPVSGGQAQPLTRPDSSKGELAHIWPVALPDGETVLFTSWTANGVQGARIGIASLSSGESTTLDLPGVYALGVFDDHLVYVRAEGTMMAVPVDVGRRRVSGTAFAVLSGIVVEGNAVARIAVSQNGWLAYLTGGTTSRLVVVDEQGLSRSVMAEDRPYEFARFSPDGRRIAVSLSSPQGTDVWLHDIAAGTFEKLTSGGASRLEWTPDGRRVLFRSSRGGRNSTWWQPADLSAPAEKLFDLPTGAVDEALITSDGRYFVYRVLNARTRRDIYYARMDSLGATKPLLTGPSDEYMPRVSPDGRWLAYVSDESGQPEVYVRPFPGPPSRAQVSVGGGVEPMWAPDGRRLFYRTERQLVAATFTVTPTFAVTGRRVLFEGNYGLGTIHPAYDVARDGRHFLMLQRSDEGTQLVLVMNWTQRLRERIAAARAER